MKFCPDCRTLLEELGLVPECSGQWLYGCPKCDALWKVRGYSITERISGCHKSWQKYSEWKKQQNGN